MSKCRTCSKHYNIHKPKYGVTGEWYEQTFRAQGGKCAICNQTSEVRFHVDHDHKTGRIRSLLCGNCNRAIGLMNDDPKKCRAAAEYLEKQNQIQVPEEHIKLWDGKSRWTRPPEMRTGKQRTKHMCIVGMQKKATEMQSFSRILNQLSIKDAGDHCSAGLFPPVPLMGNPLMPVLSEIYQELQEKHLNADKELQ